MGPSTFPNTDMNIFSGAMSSEVCALRDDAVPPGLLEVLCVEPQDPPGDVTCACCYCE